VAFQSHNPLERLRYREPCGLWAQAQLVPPDDYLQQVEGQLEREPG